MSNALPKRILPAERPPLKWSFAPGAWLLGFLLVALAGSPGWARVKLEGRVTDAETQKGVAGTTVYIKNLRLGTTTDERGFYSIIVPFGEHTVTFSAVGFRSQTKTLAFNDDIRLNVELVADTRELEEVVVKGRAADHNVKEVQMGTLQLDLLKMRKIPVVLGEVDVVKALIAQPGVTTVGEGAGGFNVRGGRADQNLVLLDEAPLYNTSHLLGFFASVNPDVLQDVTLYKGSFPAKFGGRTSSLLEMHTKEGDSRKHSYSVGISPVSLRLYADGPVVKEKLAFVAAARLAYPTWLLRIIPNTREYQASFYDVNARLTYSINPANRISLSAYRSYDEFKFAEDTVYGWKTNLVSLRWTSLLSRTLSFSLSGIHTDYQYNIDGIKPNYEYRVTSSIRHREAKAGLLYTVEGRHRAEVGGNAIWYALQPGNQQPTGGNSSVNQAILQEELAREMAFYASEEYTITPAITLQAGIRYSWFAQTGPRQVYLYQPDVPRSNETLTDTVSYDGGAPIRQYGGWEPRVSLRVGVGAQSALKASYSRARQYVHLISNTTAISPVDFWKISDTYVPPQIADQFALGFFRNFSENNYETSVEGFYKDLQNLIEYKNGARLLMNPLLEADLLRAKGKAYGVEVSVRKNRGTLTGQLGYTFSRSFAAVQTPYTAEQINDGQYYPSLFDRPHMLNATTQVLLGRNWTLGANFVYTTGRPTTFPDGLYVFNNAVLANYSKRNLDRLPDYHRLDVSFSKDTRKKKDQRHYSVWIFSLYNLYARKNPYSVYYTQTGSFNRSYRLAVFGTIIPSLNLNFYF